MTAQVPTPDVSDVGAILHGLSEAGTYDHIARGVADVARSALTGQPLARALARLRAMTTSAAWRQSVAEDVLARLDRPLTEVDEETLGRVMSDAATAAVYELGEEIIAAVGGA